ncbi:hypothetical protein CVT25_012619 [Psilocybe cyanescens]|uniref:Uncharacterized protein n=1 Tax=Psilocybe cyanescens TaxID=93625 RepID=A0A409XJ60_PSICY|nr:hypothetical protein CVT25_012619 [Psilocybe cyanescens]
MFNRALTSFAVLAAAWTAASMPVSDSGAVVARGTEASPVVSVCTAQVCLGIPLVSDTCVSFTGGFSVLASQVISAVTPGGFVCAFTPNFNCDLSQGDFIALSSGTWDFSNVPGPNGNVNFDGRAESFLCSPV